MTRKPHRDRRAALLIAALAGMLGLAILFAPDDAVTGIMPRLTTHSRHLSGARGFYETADRLGWNVSRHERATLPVPDSTRVYAVLAPPIQWTDVEVHELLERVRRGAGLFAVLRERSPLTDSLGIRFRGRYGRIPEDTAARCDPPRRMRAAEALRGTIWATAFDVPAEDVTVESFLGVELRGEPAASVAAGYDLGAGRVGVVADPDLLTNSVFRICRLEAGVSMVRLLTFVSSDTAGRFVRPTVLFDEYHHGYGSQPSITRVATRFLAQHPLGRAIAHASLAGVVLLVAVGTRPLPPGPPERRTRRSPLEHAQALSQAYSRISATRTATRLLVRGLRRRLRLTGTTGISRARTDDEFLEHIRARHPALTPHVERIARALDTPVGKGELAAIGRSIATIERTVTSGNQ